MGRLGLVALVCLGIAGCGGASHHNVSADQQLAQQVQAARVALSGGFNIKHFSCSGNAAKSHDLTCSVVAAFRGPHNAGIAHYTCHLSFVSGKKFPGGDCMGQENDENGIGESGLLFHPSNKA